MTVQLPLRMERTAFLDWVQGREEHINRQAKPAESVEVCLASFIALPTGSNVGGRYSAGMPAMHESERLSALTGDIYDAALDASLWVDVLDKTKHFVGGQAFVDGPPGVTPES